jgi:hypothetical protein
MTASGCTSVNVKPVVNVSEIKQVCIRDSPDQCFVGDMLQVIIDGFNRNGISTQIYSANENQNGCEYRLTYMCNQTWDMAMYMTHAELRLFHGREQVGYAQYHLTGDGGLSLMKWQGTKTKMDPVIDELLGKTNPNN